MVIEYNSREYLVETEDSKLVREIEALLPLTLKMKKNGSAEYTGTLPLKPHNDGRKITHTEPNGIYYYEGWNCLCLNIEAHDISPWYVNNIGMAAGGLAEALEKQTGEITVTIR